MSIIGGFFYFENTPDQHDIHEVLNQFHCLSSESTHDDKIEVTQYAHGYLFSKGKQNIRSLITSKKDSLGNAFLMLGYSNLNDWKAWNVSQDSLALPDVFGPSFSDKLTEMEGEYTAFYFDAKTDILHVINDRFGSRPLFYLKTSKGVFFCSNIILLLCLCRYKVTLNPLGLMQQLCFGHPVGETTHITGVQRLFPASHLQLTSGQLNQRRYWHLNYAPQTNLNPKTFCNQVYAAFREGTVRRAHLMKQGLVALSGGLDSRLIAGSLPDDADFSFYTFYSSLGKPLMDFQVASQIAQILHRRHLTKEWLPGAFSSAARDLTFLVGGLIPMNHSLKSLPPSEFGYDLYMAGGPGDNLIGSYVPSIHATLESRVNEFINSFTKITDPSLFLYFLSKDMFYTHLQEYQDFMQDSFDSIKSPTAAHKISAWNMIYPGLVFSNTPHSHPYMSQIRPHLDYAYNDLILKLPALWLYQKQFYKYMIYHALPRLQKVVYANTNLPLSGKIGPSSRPEWFYKFYSLRRRLAAGWNTLFPHHTSSGCNFELMLIRQDAVFTDTIENILLSYPFFKDYFNVDQCIKYIRDIKSDTTPQVQVYCKEEPLCFLAAIAYFYQIVNSC